MASSELDIILTRIRAFRKSEAISYSALAQKAGLSRAALIGMDEPTWSPAADTIRRLEDLVRRSASPPKRKKAA